MLASVAEQASLSLTWSETPDDTFSHDEAYIMLVAEWRTKTPHSYSKAYTKLQNVFKFNPNKEVATVSYNL